MIVFERIFLYLFGELRSSSWKCSRRVLRSFTSSVYSVSVKEDVNVRLRSVYQTPITWTKKSNWLSYSRIINWG